jgi:hypothetical protein
MGLRWIGPLPPDDPIFSVGLISVFGKGGSRPEPKAEEQHVDDVEEHDVDEHQAS